MDAINDGVSKGIAQDRDSTLSREQARAIWGNTRHGSGRDGMHEHDGRYASRFGRRDRTQEDEVADDHVSRLPTQFRRDSFGPGRCPERRLGFALNGPERLWHPAANETVSEWRWLHRMNVGVGKRNENCSCGAYPVTKGRAHR
jgi:hypothetical protein